jgi:hypothetical protein
MNNVERIALSACLFLGGVAIGMYYEHQRFLAEIQGLSKKHSEPPGSTPAPPPAAPAPEGATA